MKPLNRYYPALASVALVLLSIAIVLFLNRPEPMPNNVDKDVAPTFTPELLGEDVKG